MGVDKRFLDPVPEVGKRYHFFDDGKSSPSRHYIFEVTKVTPFNQMRKRGVKSRWKEDVNDCYWLYATSTDYFVEAFNVSSPDEKLTFCRTVGGQWFSFGNFLGDGLLDVTGEKYRDCIEYYEGENEPGWYDRTSQTEGLI